MKTNKLGKILVVALFVMLFVLVLTVSVNAANTDVSTADGLTTALGSAKSGDTVTVTATITLPADAAITVPAGVELKGSANPLLTVSGTTATVTVNGKVTASKDFVKLQSGGNLTLKANTGSEIALGGRLVDASYEAVAAVLSVQLEGSKITSTLSHVNQGLVHFEKKHADSAVTWTISDTEISAPKVALFCTGSLNSADKAVCTITNSTVTCYDVINSNSGGNGIVNVGTGADVTATLAIFSTGGAYTSMTVNVTGGVLKAAELASNGGVIESALGGPTALNVTGGAVTVTNPTAVNNLTTSVSGGTMTVSGSAYPFVGTEVAENSTTGVKYASLKAAIEAANDGDTIVVLSGSTVSETINVTKSITITSSSPVAVIGTVTEKAEGAYKTFAVSAGVSLTLSGSVAYADCGFYVDAGDALTTITIKDSVSVRNGTKCHVIATVASNVTVNVEKGVYLQGNYIVSFAGTVTTGKKTVSINGATLVGSHIAVFFVDTEGELTVEDSTIRATNTIAYLENASKNTVTVKNSNITVTGNQPMIDVKARATATVGIENVTLDGYELLHFRANAKGTATITGGTYKMRHDFIVTDGSTVADAAGDEIAITINNANVTVASNAIIAVKNPNKDSSKTNQVSLTITGGTYRFGGNVLWTGSTDGSGSTFTTSKITINSGTFIHTKASGSAYFFQTGDWQGKPQVTINGGTFKWENASANRSDVTVSGFGETGPGITAYIYGGNFEGLDYLVSTNRGTDNITIGKEGATSFPTVNVNKTVFHVYGNRTDNEGKLVATIWGGTFTAGENIMDLNQSDDATKNISAQLTLNGGTYTATAGRGFYYVKGASCTVLLNNAIITSNLEVFKSERNSGSVNLTIKKGTYTSNTERVIYPNSASVTVVLGNADDIGNTQDLVVETKAARSKQVIAGHYETVGGTYGLTIYGGSYLVKNCNVVDFNKNIVVDITVYGGKFTATGTDAEGHIFDIETGLDCTLNIYGGEFTAASGAFIDFAGSTNATAVLEEKNGQQIIVNCTLRDPNTGLIAAQGNTSKVDVDIKSGSYTTANGPMFGSNGQLAADVTGGTFNAKWLLNGNGNGNGTTQNKITANIYSGTTVVVTDALITDGTRRADGDTDYSCTVNIYGGDITAPKLYTNGTEMANYSYVNLKSTTPSSTISFNNYNITLTDEENLVEANGTLYTDIATALATAVADENGKITVTVVKGDFTISETLQINGNVEITTDENSSFTVLYTGQGYAFHVNENASLTLSGNMTWLNGRVSAEDKTTVTFAGNVVVDCVKGKHHVYNNVALGNATVYVKENAYLIGNYIINFEGDAGTGTKTVNVSGGTLEGNHIIVFNKTGVDTEITISGGTFNTVYTAIYLNNDYVEANGNVSNVTITGGSFTATNNDSLFIAKPGASANFSISGVTAKGYNFVRYEAGTVGDRTITISDSEITCQNVFLINKCSGKSTVSISNCEIDAIDCLINFQDPNSTDGLDVTLTNLTSSSKMLVYVENTRSEAEKKNGEAAVGFDVNVEINGGSYEFTHHAVNIAGSDADIEGTVTVLGGSFTSITAATDDTSMFFTSDAQNHMYVNVYGGTFAAKNADAYVSVFRNNGSKLYVNVYGGTFEGNLDQIVSAYRDDTRFTVHTSYVNGEGVTVNTTPTFNATYIIYSDANQKYSPSKPQIVLNGGTYTATEAIFYTADSADEGNKQTLISKIEINGGTFSAKHLSYQTAGTICSAAAPMVINGGTFNTTADLIHSAGGTMYITINNITTCTTGASLLRINSGEVHMTVNGGSYTTGSHVFHCEPGAMYLTVTAGTFSTTNAANYFVNSRFANAVIDIDCDNDEDVQAKGFSRIFGLLYHYGENYKPGTVADPLGEINDANLFVTVSGGTFEATDRMFSYTDSGKGVFRISGGKFTTKGGEGFSFYNSASASPYIYITGGTWESVLRDTNTGMFSSHNTGKQYITISGGTFTCTNGPVFGYSAKVEANVTGGVFNAQWLVNANGGVAPGADLDITVSKTATVNLSSTVYKDPPDDGASTTASSHAFVTLAGGTLTATRIYPYANENLNDCMFVMTGGTYNGRAYVAEENVAKIGDAYFPSLQAAIDFIQDDTTPVTITLVGAHTITETVEIKKNVIITGGSADAEIVVSNAVTSMADNTGYDTFKVAAGKSVTFTGHVYYLLCSVFPMAAADATTTVTFAGNVIFDNDVNTYTVRTNNTNCTGGKLVINVQESAYLTAHHVMNFGAAINYEINISGGTINAAQSSAIYQSAGVATIKMTGGSFTGVSNAFRPVGTHCDIEVTGGTFDIGGHLLHGTNFTGTVTITGDTKVISCNMAFAIETDSDTGVTSALTDAVTVKKDQTNTMSAAPDVVVTVSGNAQITSKGYMFQHSGNLHVKVDIVGAVQMTCNAGRFFYLKDYNNSSAKAGEWTVINVGADAQGNAPTLKFAGTFLHFDSVGTNYSYYNLNVSAGTIESIATANNHCFINAGDANARMIVTVTGGTFRRAEGVSSTGTLCFIAYTSNPALWADVSNATIEDIASFWTDSGMSNAATATLRLSGNVSISSAQTDAFPGLFYMKNASTLNLTVEGGTFTATGDVIYSAAGKLYVTVNGGTFTTPKFFTNINNSTGTLTLGGTAKVTAGERGISITGNATTVHTEKIKVYQSLDKDGNKSQVKEEAPHFIVNVTGGELTAGKNAIYFKDHVKAHVKISGGTLTTTQTIGGNTGALVFKINDSTANDWLVVDVTGGTLKAQDYMFASGSIAGNRTYTNVNITAGTFTTQVAAGKQAYIFATHDYHGTLLVDVSGGKFSAANDGAYMGIAYNGGIQEYVYLHGTAEFEDVNYVLSNTRKDNATNNPQIDVRAVVAENVKISGKAGSQYQAFFASTSTGTTYIYIKGGTITSDYGMIAESERAGTMHMEISGGKIDVKTNNAGRSLFGCFGKTYTDDNGTTHVHEGSKLYVTMTGGEIITDGTIFGHEGFVEATVSGGTIKAKSLVNGNGATADLDVTVTGTAKVELTHEVFYDAGAAGGAADVTLSGGTLTATKVYQAKPNMAASFTITGGTYNGAVYVDNEDDVVAIGNTYYGSLKDALGAITDDSTPVTITLVGGMTVTETIVIDKNVIITGNGGDANTPLLVQGKVTTGVPGNENAFQTFKIAAGKSVTFAGNVRYLTTTFFVDESAEAQATTITFMDKVEILNSDYADNKIQPYAIAALNAEAKGTLTVNLKGNAQITARHCIVVQTGMTYNINISDSVKLTSIQSSTVYVGGGVSTNVKMTGGTFEGVSLGFQIFTSANVEITGGTFNINSTVLLLRTGTHTLTMKDVTITKSATIVQVDKGGSLGTAAKPAVIENVTATIAGSVFVSEWNSGTSVIHIKSGNYTISSASVAFLSRGKNNTLILGTEGGKDTDMVVTLNAAAHMFGGHKEMRDADDTHDIGIKEANRGIYNVTIYNGTYYTKGGSKNLFDLNRGLDGSITIHGGIFTIDSGNMFDIWGEYDLDQDGNTFIVNGTPFVDPTTGAAIGYNAVDVTVLGGTFTSSGYFINASCYTGVITVENANVAKCSRIINIVGGDNDYTQADGKKTAYVKGTGGAPVISDSIGAWMTANGLTAIKVKDDLSGTPHVVIVMKNVTATSTGHGIVTNGAGNVYIKIDGADTEMDVTNTLLYRNTCADATKAWQVTDIKAGKFTSPYDQMFEFPGGALNPVDDLFIAFNISGGEFEMTNAGTTTNWKGVHMFDFHKAATVAILNISGGNFKYAPADRSKVTATNYFFLSQSTSHTINMAGGTIEGFEKAFWCLRGTTNITLGAEGATTFPTIKVSKMVVDATAGSWEGSGATTNITIWGGEYTVEGGYIFYVANGKQRSNNSGDLVATLNFTIHAGKYTAKSLVYQEKLESAKQSVIGSAAKPSLIKSGTFISTEEMIYTNLAKVFITVEGGSFDATLDFMRLESTTGKITMTGGKVTADRWGFYAGGDVATALTNKVNVHTTSSYADGVVTDTFVEKIADLQIDIGGTADLTSSSSMLIVSGKIDALVNISGNAKLTCLNQSVRDVDHWPETNVQNRSEMFVRNSDGNGYWTKMTFTGTPTVTFSHNQMFCITSVGGGQLNYFDIDIDGGAFIQSSTTTAGTFFASWDWQGAMNIDVSGGAFKWENTTEGATQTKTLRGFQNQGNQMNVKLSGGTFEDIDILFLGAGRSDKAIPTATVVISGNFTATTTGAHVNNGMFFTNAVGTKIYVVMEGGTLNCATGPVFGNNCTMEATVSGGTINARNLINMNGGSVNAKVTITGTADVNLTGYVFSDAPNTATSQTDLLISGGTVDAVALYPQNMNGTCSVTITGGYYNGAGHVLNENGVAQIGNSYYASLQEAIDEADDTNGPVTITLVGPITVIETIVIDKNVIITGNGGNESTPMLVYGMVTAAHGGAFKTFQIVAGNSVTFAGNVRYLSCGFFVEESAEGQETVITFTDKVEINNSTEITIDGTAKSYAFAARNADAKGKLTVNVSGNAQITARHCIILTSAGMEYTVNVTGGTITSIESSAVYGNLGTFDINVSAGTFKGSSNAIKLVNATAGSVDVTGGSFSMADTIIQIDGGSYSSITLKNVANATAKQGLWIVGNANTDKIEITDCTDLTLTQALIELQGGTHDGLTVKNVTATADYGIQVKKGATLGTDAAPAVLENVTLTTVQFIYCSDWSAGKVVLHVKSGTYATTTTDSTKNGRAFCSRGINDTVIMGEQKSIGSNDALKVTVTGSFQVFTAHKELKNASGVLESLVANRQQYSLTIYNGTYNTPSTFFDANRGVDGDVTIHGGVINCPGLIFDLSGGADISDTSNAELKIGYIALDITVKGGTLTSTGNSFCYANYYVGSFNIEGGTFQLGKYFIETKNASAVITAKNATVTGCTYGFVIRDDYAFNNPAIAEKLTAMGYKDGEVSPTDGISSAPHYILTVENVTLSATNDVFYLEKCGNILVDISGKNTALSAGDRLVYRTFYAADEAKEWAVVNISGGTLTSAGAAGFYIPGSGTLKGTNYVAFNISGGEIIMTKAAVRVGAKPEGGLKEYVEEEQRGVNVFQIFKWAVHAYLNVTGGTFTYAPVGEIGEGQAAPQTYFFQGGNNLSEVKMTGGTIQGFDTAFWGNYSGKGLLVTLGEENGNSFPTIKVNTAIFYTAPHYHETNSGNLTATVWGGEYTVENGYIFYVNGYQHIRVPVDGNGNTVWKSGTMNFAVHGGTFNAKHFLYHWNGNTGINAENPATIDGDVTINATAQPFYFRDNNAYLKLDSADIEVIANTHVFLAESPMDNLTITINGGTYKALVPESATDADRATANYYRGFRIFSLQCQNDENRKLNVTVNGGTFESDGEFMWVGRWRERNITVKAGTINVHYERFIYITEGGATAKGNIVLGDAENVNVNDKLFVTTHAKKGGTGNQLFVNHNGYFELTVYGGTYVSKAYSFVDLNGGNYVGGKINVLGGDFTVNTHFIDAEGTNNADADKTIVLDITMSGGAVNAGDQFIHARAVTGTFTLSGGTVSCKHAFVVQGDQPTTKFAADTDKVTVKTTATKNADGTLTYATIEELPDVIINVSGGSVTATHSVFHITTANNALVNVSGDDTVLTAKGSDKLFWRGNAVENASRWTVLNVTGTPTFICGNAQMFSMGDIATDHSYFNINIAGGNFIMNSTAGGDQYFFYEGDWNGVMSVNVTGGAFKWENNTEGVLRKCNLGAFYSYGWQMNVEISSIVFENIDVFMVGDRQSGYINAVVSDCTLQNLSSVFYAKASCVDVTLSDCSFQGHALTKVEGFGAVIITDDGSNTFNVNALSSPNYVYIEVDEDTYGYATFEGAVTHAPDGATAYVVGDITVGATATLDTKLTITGNGSVNGSVVFITLADGAELILNGDVTYNSTTNLVQVAEGVTGTVSVTFGKGTYRVSGGGKTGAVFLDQSLTANTTVNVVEGADIRVGGWGIAFGENRGADGSGIKTVNMTGGYLSGSHGITFAMGGVQANITVSGGTIETANENFYMDNKQFNADGQNNVTVLTITGGEFITTGNMIMFNNDSAATVTISNITVDGVNRLVYMNSSATVNTTLSDVTATVKGGVIVAYDHETKDGKCKGTAVINGGTYTILSDSFVLNNCAALTVKVNRSTVDDKEPVINAKKYITYTYNSVGVTYAVKTDFVITAGVFECGSGMFIYTDAVTGNVTISGGSFNCTLNSSNGTANGPIHADAATTFNISGGSFTSLLAPMFGQSGTLMANLSGGEFYCNYLLNSNGTVANETVNISGNAVVNADIAVLTDGTAGSVMNLNIAGGKVVAPLLQTGAFQITCTVTFTGGELTVRDVTMNGNVIGSVNVVLNETTGTYYTTLEEAVLKAADKDVLVLTSNVIVIRETVVVENKSITIKGGTPEAPIKVVGIIDSPDAYGTRIYGTFKLLSNASVTFTGDVEYLETGIIAEGDNITVTFAGNVKFDNARRSDVFNNNNSIAEGDVTVYVTENATLIGNYAIYFTGDNSMTLTDAIKSAYMSGGLIEANHGFLIQYLNGVTGHFELTGGVMNVDSSAIWLDSANVEGKRITVVLDGITIESKGMGLNSEDTELLVDVIVKGNTFIHAGTDASGNGDYCIEVMTKENEKPSTVTIYGGTFISGTGHATIQVTSACANRVNAEEAYATSATIYGGYFKASANATVRASSGGYLYIFGGYFCFDADPTAGGGPVRLGTGTEDEATVGNAYVYGGNFVSKSVGAAINCINDVSNAVVYAAGVNANGGSHLLNSSNSSVDKIYYPSGLAHADGLISMTDGAGVRIIEGSNGLRFVSIVTAEAIAYLESLGATNVKYGTLIAPTDIVAQARTFTIADLKAAGLPYLDIEAKDGLVARPGGGFYIRAAITNIKEGNYDREFAAVGYITYTLEVNGEPVTFTVYTSYRDNKNARSIEQVARLALRDGDSYSAAQQDVLKEFAPKTEAPVIDFYLMAGQSNAAGSTQFSDAIASLKPEYTEGFSHIFYSGSSNRARRINVPMKIGYGSAADSFGAELGMAEALSQYYNEETGRYAAIIKYAYGGTRLYDNLTGSDGVEGNWMSNTWIERNGCKDEQLSGGLFRGLIAHIASSVADYEAMGYEVNIQSIYWMQGESDISANGKDKLYDDMFKCWVDDVRSSVAEIMGDESYLNLPVLVGEISEYFGSNAGELYHRYNLEFVQMQREIIGSWDNVYVIPQGNVPTVDWPNDNSHWGYHDHLWNGYMTGSKMLELAHGFYTSVSEEDAVAEVWLDGQLLGTYNTLGGAISMAPEGAVVKLLKDIQLYTTLAIGNRNTITLDGCGHKIDFTPKQSNVGNYSALKFFNTDITVKDLHVINHSYTEWDKDGKETNLATYGAVLNFNAKVTWIGGYLEAERHGFVLNNAQCELTIISGDFQLRDTAISYAAIIFTETKETKITVEGGTFNGGVGTGHAVFVGSGASGVKIVLNGGTFTAGEDSANVIKGHSATSTIIVGEGAVLNGNVDNAGLSQ